MAHATTDSRRRGTACPCLAFLQYRLEFYRHFCWWVCAKIATTILCTTLATMRHQQIMSRRVDVVCAVEGNAWALGQGYLRNPCASIVGRDDDASREKMLQPLGGLWHASFERISPLLGPTLHGGRQGRGSKTSRSPRRHCTSCVDRLDNSTIAPDTRCARGRMIKSRRREPGGGVVADLGDSARRLSANGPAFGTAPMGDADASPRTLTPPLRQPPLGCYPCHPILCARLPQAHCQPRINV